MFGAAALARRAGPASFSRHMASSSRLHPPLSPSTQLPPLLLSPPPALLPPSLLSPPLARSAASEGDESETGSLQSPSAPSSKREWQQARQQYLDRLARCKNLLSTTLPEFLRLGVVDYDLGSAAEFFPGDGRRPAYFSEMRFAFLTPPPRVSNRELRRQAQAAANRRKPTPEEEDAAFAMPHFALHGRTLYMASAQLLRLTLLALFSNPSLALERIYLVDHSSNRPTNATSTALTNNQRHAYVVRMRFEGTLRVVGTHQTFTIRSKYKISALGDICVHQIERVEPELGGKLWAGLRATFLRLAGFSRRNDPHPMPACLGRSPRRSALSAMPAPRTRGWHSSAALRDSRQQLGAIDRRLSLSFTCTAGETSCGHRSAHEFSAKSYEKGIVIVQCPKCKSRHLIADHLGWFKDSDEARTVEGIVAAHGGRVRRGSLRDHGETLEIDSDEGEGEGAGIGEPVPDAQPGADDDKWWKEPK